MKFRPLRYLLGLLDGMGFYADGVDEELVETHHISVPSALTCRDGLNCELRSFPKDEAATAFQVYMPAAERRLMRPRCVRGRQV